MSDRTFLALLLLQKDLLRAVSLSLKNKHSENDKIVAVHTHTCVRVGYSSRVDRAKATGRESAFCKKAWVGPLESRLSRGKQAQTKRNVSKLVKIHPEGTTMNVSCRAAALKPTEQSLHASNCTKQQKKLEETQGRTYGCLLYTSPSQRD